MRSCALGVRTAAATSMYADRGATVNAGTPLLAPKKPRAQHLRNTAYRAHACDIAGHVNTAESRKTHTNMACAAAPGTVVVSIT